MLKLTNLTVEAKNKMKHYGKVVTIRSLNEFVKTTEVCNSLIRDLLSTEYLMPIEYLSMN